MGMWWILFACDLLTPAIMIVAGWMMEKRTPTDINWAIGYRTSRSMKNMDTWNFAHEHCGRLWQRVGWAMLALTVAAHLPFIGASEDALGAQCAVVITLQMIALIGSIFPTERALKRAFNDDGTRK